MEMTSQNLPHSNRAGKRAADLMMLADNEVLLRERINNLEADIRVYHAIAQQGIHALHHVTAERDRLRHLLQEAA